MKQWTHSVLIGALLLLLPVLSIAQLDELKNTTPEDRASFLTKRMETELKLDDKATAAVSAINLKYAKETQVLMDSDGPQLGKLMQFRENSRAKDAELQGVLTPEQYSQYEQKKADMQATMKQKLMEKSRAAQ